MLERSPVQATESFFDEEGSFFQNKMSGEVTRIRAEDANLLFVMIDEETGDKYSRVVEKKGLGVVGEGHQRRVESMGPPRRRRTPVDPEVRW